MYKKALRVAAFGLAGVLTLTGIPAVTYAAPVAGVFQPAESAAVDTSPLSGVSLCFSDYMTRNEQDVKTADNQTPVVQQSDATGKGSLKGEYADIAIAQVDNYVNIRSEPNTDSEVVGKLYNNSAAKVYKTVDDWYQITSGTVTGYVKSEYVVRDNEELARNVSRRVATVQTDGLFVRAEASTESDKLGQVPNQEELTVTDESVDGWVKVEIEEGEGYVSMDYVTLSTEFVQAESKREEEARLAKEEAERQAALRAAEAAEAARKASRRSSGSSSSGGGSSSSGGSYSAPSGSGGSAVANYACQFVGNPYVYGGTSLTNGADCSGFVMAVYAAFGVSLPHSSSAMRGCGYEVSQDAMQPGDIVCYSGHVGIYIGGGTLVHASTPESGIKYSNVYYKTILSVRRIF